MEVRLSSLQYDHPVCHFGAARGKRMCLPNQLTQMVTVLGFTTFKISYYSRRTTTNGYASSTVLLQQQTNHNSFQNLSQISGRGYTQKVNQYSYVPPQVSAGFSWTPVDGTALQQCCRSNQEIIRRESSRKELAVHFPLDVSILSKQLKNLKNFRSIICVGETYDELRL